MLERKIYDPFRRCQPRTESARALLELAASTEMGLAFGKYAKGQKPYVAPNPGEIEYSLPVSSNVGLGEN